MEAQDPTTPRTPGDVALGNPLPTTTLTGRTLRSTHTGCIHHPRLVPTVYASGMGKLAHAMIILICLSISVGLLVLPAWKQASVRQECETRACSDHTKQATYHEGICLCLDVPK